MNEQVEKWLEDVAKKMKDEAARTGGILSGTFLNEVFGTHFPPDQGYVVDPKEFEGIGREHMNTTNETYCTAVVTFIDGEKKIYDWITVIRYEEHYVIMETKSDGIVILNRDFVMSVEGTML